MADNFQKHLGSKFAQNRKFKKYSCTSIDANQQLLSFQANRIIKLFISSITTAFTCFTGNHENLDSCKKLSNINQNDKITHLPKCFFRVEWLLYSKKFYCHFLQIQNEGRRHIWRNFATLAKILKTLAIFWMAFLGLVKIFNLLWQNNICYWAKFLNII